MCWRRLWCRPICATSGAIARARMAVAAYPAWVLQLGGTGRAHSKRSKMRNMVRPMSPRLRRWQRRQVAFRVAADELADITNQVTCRRHA